MGLHWDEPQRFSIDDLESEKRELEEAEARLESDLAEAKYALEGAPEDATDDEIFDIEQEIGEAEEALEEWRSEYADELSAVSRFLDDVGGCDEAIREDCFEDHAQELAEDVFGVDLGKWPFTCIDWKDAADELRHDYTIATLDKSDYYCR